MAIKEQVGGLPKGPNDGAADRHDGNKVSVHDIDVEKVRRVLHLRNLISEVRKICGKD